MILDQIQCNASDVIVDTISSVRIKVTDRCSFKCFFCHHEGSINTNDLELDYSLRHSLERLRVELRITEAHLTGGEPTIYPHIIKLVDLLSKLGYRVKMTTNGQFSESLLKKLKEAGLKGLNFSVHTLNSDYLAKMHCPPRNSVWGRKALEKQINNIRVSMELGLITKINTVVPGGTMIESVIPIIEFTKERNLDLRILDDLSYRSTSIETIMEMLSSLGAKIEDVRVSDGSSGYSVGVVLEDGFRMRIKSIRQMILKSMCSYCDVREHCKEWFYGIRIEQKEDRALARLCVHRQDYPAVHNLTEFFSSIQYDELISLVGS